MPEAGPPDDEVRVDVRGDTLVVTIPEGVTVDVPTAKNINREYMDLLRSHDLDGCLTVLESADGVQAKAIEEVRRAGAAAVALGISRWAVVDKADSHSRMLDQLEGIETREFDEIEPALAWTNGGDA